MDWLYRRTKEVLLPSCCGKTQTTASFLLPSRSRQTGLPLSLGLCLLIPELAFSEPVGESVRFNTAFIHGGEQPADIHAFLEGNSVLPGTYRVDLQS